MSKPITRQASAVQAYRIYRIWYGGGYPTDTRGYREKFADVLIAIQQEILVMRKKRTEDKEQRKRKNAKVHLKMN